jgi:hypothetical protein
LKEDFNSWRLLGYKPNVPLTNIHNVHGPLCTGPTPAESFERGIKKDKDQCPEFTDEKNWYNFCRDVEATPATHNTIEVLDFAYTPNYADADNVALFASKNRWMYSVLSAKVNTDAGMEIIKIMILTATPKLFGKNSLTVIKTPKSVSTRRKNSTVI